MQFSRKYYLLFFLFAWLQLTVSAQAITYPDLKENFLHPPASAKPWVLWYWMHAAISKEGITADLEAMKEVGIGGAYIVTIQDTLSTIPFRPTVRQLTPEWWAMIKFTMQESKRLGLQLGMHVSDGFALAGGPWITPELCMQKLVWTKTYVTANQEKIKLEQPETIENYYRDVAVFAYPATVKKTQVIPQVSSSNGDKPQYLAVAEKDNKQSFRSDTACWIQYEYAEPYTCRSICIHTSGNNFQAQRLIIEKSEDGKQFMAITRLQPPRHGWQDTDEDYTYSIPATTAKYFRFVYNKEGTEPGAEDLDAAKWKPTFKVSGIYLNNEPVINNFEGKNGSVWRVAMNITAAEVSNSEAVQLKSILNLTDKMDASGNLNYKVPEGWVVVRMGHTSTGHTNATGGAAKGLECDKFNEAAVTLQFNNWFGKAFEMDTELSKEVLKIFYVDSWECGSQNWSTNFREEFKKRRGYDLMPYLLVMAGIPVQDAAISEKVLHDVRQTIAELVNDVFYTTLNKLAHEKGCLFTAESVAPTMVSDGILHYKNVDIPMGEFWLNSPTHDKPNDMLDAINGAHVYGKNIIAAEAFTTVRMNWAEHPGMLKTLQDRNYALGINRLVYHVFTHNPFLHKKPGVTLDGVGLYFQRDQTWWKQGKAWVEYATRCQALLQLGKQVVDIAVFTGEQIPRRSVLPDRLVPVLPGLFGKERVEAERKRLANVGEPLQNIPDGVSSSANTYQAKNWIDPLNGYQYDCLNPDVLKTASVKNGRIILPGGADYGVLVFPGKTKMDPNGDTLSTAMHTTVQRLIDAGAKVIAPPGMKLKANAKAGGKVLPLPYQQRSLSETGIEPDILFLNESGFMRGEIAWTHRSGQGFDIYFISNQIDSGQLVKMSFPVTGKIPEVWNAVDKTVTQISDWKTENGRTVFSSHFERNQSLFIIFRNKGFANQKLGGKTYQLSRLLSSLIQWQVKFDKNYGGPDTPVTFNKFISWSQHSDSSIKYYSGTAIYRNTFQMNTTRKAEFARLEFDSICNTATIKINGINCGTVWTTPFTVDITKAIKTGENSIEIEVSNTWHNRLIGDNLLPVEKRVTWTTAPFRLKDKPLLPAGIIGNIKLTYR